MKKLFSLILVACIICSCSACSQGRNNSRQSETSAAQTSKTAERTLTPQEKLAETIASIGYSGVVSIVKDGEAYASYTADTLKDSGEITLDTPMPIGSNSKHMCAAIILLLQERGLLNVDDTLEKYYPEYGNVKNVTIRNLLTMTAGIKDVTPTELPYHKNATKEQEHEDIDASRRMILSNELQFTPGERHAYTNVNYFLLSDIAKSVSGKDISTLMRENIFEPLKMTHSGTVYELQDSPEWADGYSYDFDNVPINCNMVGSGGVIASASDMQIWLNALPSGKVISAESYAMLTTPFNESIPYGFGISIGKDGAVGHAGFIGSYYSTFDIDLGKKLTVFLASDTIGVETLQDIMFNRILPQIG